MGLRVSVDIENTLALKLTLSFRGLSSARPPARLNTSDPIDRFRLVKGQGMNKPLGHSLSQNGETSLTLALGHTFIAILLPGSRKIPSYAGRTIKKRDNENIEL